MLEFESYKNEIVDSINELKEEQELTNKILEEQFKTETVNGTDPEDEEYEDIEKVNEEDDISHSIQDDKDSIELTDFEESETEILIEQNEILIEKLEELNHNQIESAWTISIVIVIALGFHYFINQFSKW